MRRIPGPRIGRIVPSGGGWSTQVNVRRTERWISASGRRRPARPTGSAAGAFAGGAPAGRHRPAAPRADGPLRVNRALGGIRRRDEGRASPVASLERGEGRKIEQTVIDSPAPRRAVPLLAPVRQPAALHGQSRVGHGPGQPAVPLGREGTLGHARRMGRRDPQRDRGRAHRLALPAGRRCRSGGVRPLLVRPGGAHGGPGHHAVRGARPAGWGTRLPTSSATTPSGRSRTICGASSRSWTRGTWVRRRDRTTVSSSEAVRPG